ncbi:MAG: trypsin-like serine protease [Bdellovibrionota bacterium]
MPTLAAVVPAVLMILFARPAVARELWERPPSSVCFISYATEGGQMVHVCSGTLLTPVIVATASHCFSVQPSEIQGGTVNIACAVSAIATNGVPQFQEQFRATSVRVNQIGEMKPADRDSGKDFAFIKLDHAAAVAEPMQAAGSLEQVRSEFLQPSPFAAGDDMLRPDLQCRNSGFGMDRATGRARFRTEDLSPSKDIRAYVNGDHLVIRTVPNEDGAHFRHGDSGSGLYCRTSSTRPWQLLGILSQGMTRNKSTDFEDSYFAPVSTPAFRTFFRDVQAEWR